MLMQCSRNDKIVTKMAAMTAVASPIKLLNTRSTSQKTSQCARLRTRMSMTRSPNNKTGNPSDVLTSFEFSEERLFRVVDTGMQKLSVERGSSLKICTKVGVRMMTRFLFKRGEDVKNPAPAALVAGCRLKERVL